MFSHNKPQLLSSEKAPRQSFAPTSRWLAPPATSTPTPTTHRQQNPLSAVEQSGQRLRAFTSDTSTVDYRPEGSALGDQQATPRVFITGTAHTHADGRTEYVLPHTALDPRFDPLNANYFWRTSIAHSTVSSLTVILWPAPLLLLPFVYGPARTFNLLVNIGCWLGNPSDPPANVRISVQRWQLFLFHNLLTALLISAVVAFITIAWSRPAPANGNPADLAVTAWHMAWLQIIMTVLQILPRRMTITASLSHGGVVNIMDKIEPTASRFYNELWTETWP